MSKEKISKEHKVIKKFILKKDKYSQEYITKSILKNKFKNASTFMNSKIVDDKGIINLRDNSYAKVFSVDAIDLSLTSNTKKNNFFYQLKYLYQLKDLDLRICKLDDKIDLNANKDYYKKLMEEYSNEEDKINFLQEKYDRKISRTK